MSDLSVKEKLGASTTKGRGEACFSKSTGLFALYRSSSSAEHRLYLQVDSFMCFDLLSAFTAPEDLVTMRTTDAVLWVASSSLRESRDVKLCSYWEV